MPVAEKAKRGRPRKDGDGSAEPKAKRQAKEGKQPPAEKALRAAHAHLIARREQIQKRLPGLQVEAKALSEEQKRLDQQIAELENLLKGFHAQMLPIVPPPEAAASA